MKRFCIGRKGALLAMVVFVVLAAVFFALGMAFLKSVGGVLFALCLFFLISAISSLAQVFPTEPKHKKRSRKVEEKENSFIRDYVFCDSTDDEWDE